MRQLGEMSRARRQGRRRGISLLWVAFGLTVFFGVCAMVVDEGYSYYRRGDMQKAADAAAMAGALDISGSNAATSTVANTADGTAKKYTKSNGFEDKVNNVTVTTNADFTNNKFTVYINQPVQNFFAVIWGKRTNTVGVKATASFSFTTPALVNITGRNYGLNDGPMNIGLYGPEQITERGDRYSAMYKMSGSTVIKNTEYKSGGYNFVVTVPAAQFGTSAIVQLYDPDSYDSGADSSANNKQWDESGKDQYGPQGAGYAKIGSNKETKTKYTLYADNGTPYDTTDDTLISTTTIGADQSMDKKWNNTFTFNPASYRTTNSNVNFRLNATTVEGSNENGFNIRAARPGDTDATFSSGGNGSNVTAIEHMPVNFGVTGTSEVVLGEVPAGASSITINHFDSDVGVSAGSKINYWYTTSNGTKSSTYQGNALLGSAANDVVETDKIALTNFPGGTWTASYSAGQSDNTTWDMTYEGSSSGTPGSVRLIE